MLSLCGGPHPRSATAACHGTVHTVAVVHLFSTHPHSLFILFLCTCIYTLFFSLAPIPSLPPSVFPSFPFLLSPLPPSLPPQVRGSTWRQTSSSVLTATEPRTVPPAMGVARRLAETSCGWRPSTTSGTRTASPAQYDTMYMYMYMHLYMYMYMHLYMYMYMHMYMYMYMYMIVLDYEMPLPSYKLIVSACPAGLPRGLSW